MSVFHVRLAAALALAVVMSAASPCPAEEMVYVEGEDFPAYGWLDNGGDPIEIVWCSGASQGQAAGGIDLPGEWIRLKVVFPRPGCYVPHVMYQAGYGDNVKFVLKLHDPSAPGGLQTAAFGAVGWGFG
jgi:hypothetical protein